MSDREPRVAPFHGDGRRPSGSTALRAAFVWAGSGRWYAPGEVVIDAGRVARVGPCRARRVPPRALFPGLVNAHVHLQLASLPEPPREFVPWVRAVLAARRGGPAALADAAERATVEALDALLADGCTAVGEIDSLGTSPALLARARVAGRCYQELVGYDLDARAARALIARRARPGTPACASGLSPHAPYSCSAALVRAAHRAASHLAIHAAEVEEEVELCATGSGPLRDLLAGLGKWPRNEPPRRRTPIAWLDSLGVLSSRSLLVHAQCATAADLAILARRRAPVVVCPGTIAFFRRLPPDVPRWLAAGVRVALGTDSVASRDSPLSMRAELAAARRLWPSLAPEQVLAMATTEAARAIGRPGLGRIAVGGRADLLAVSLPRGRCAPAEVIDAFTAAALPVVDVWLRGARRGSSAP